MAIFIRIGIVWNRGYKSLLIEFDSQTAIALLINGCASSHTCFNLVQSIISFIQAGGHLE